jgi:hypothetical protein
MKNHEAVAWAEEFWRLAGRSDLFPRSLESSISWALPLALVKLSQLDLSGVRYWLKKEDIPLCWARNRSLEACLVARGGRGLIFLDSDDPPATQRLALAHELAHFLIDYLDPRQKALEHLGERIRDVLDGRRMATTEERLSGVLHGVKLGTFTHLMDRSAAGTVERLAILAAEDRADRLALEILAPRTVVLTRLEALEVQWREPAALVIAEETLVKEFGLPEVAGRSYGRMLVMSRRAPRSFKEWLQPRMVEESIADGKR